MSVGSFTIGGVTYDVVPRVVVPVPDPPPVVDPPVSIPSGRTVALYRKDGSASLTRIPAGINQLRHAFFQRSGLVEWGGETTAQQRTALAAWGREALISVGGSKGVVSLADRAGFTANFRRAEVALGSRGIDWDIEASAADPGAMVEISEALASGRKDSYRISFAPPGGSPVAPALLAAVQLHRSGHLVQLGQQLYEAPTYIDEVTALKALARAVDAGLPPSRVLLGTMVGNDARHWTIPMCVQVARAALKRWPDFGGCYLWSEGQEAQDAAWARAMGQVFGTL